MSSALKPLLTPQEYLTIERRAEYRSEYHRGEMFAMAGAKYSHNRIKDNIARHAGNQLENRPCQVLTSDMRVKVEATGLYTYPDVVFVCDELRFEDANQDTLLNPRSLVEVLSDSTEDDDRGTKFKHYRQISSLQECVLVAQDEPLVERHVRQPNGEWLMTEFRGLDQTLAFISVPVTIGLSEVYRGVTFSE